MKNGFYERTRYSLLSRLKDLDDQKSWQDFFDTYRRLIHGVAIRSGLSEEEAQEVLQETVITVTKKIGDFRKDPDRGSFKAWLLHTTRWRIQDQFRKRKRVEALVQHPPESHSRTAYIESIPDQSSLDWDAVWDREWEKNLMETALDRVRRQADPARYQAYDLHVNKGWEVSKVAEILGMTANQVYAAKYKIVELLKKEIDRLKLEM